MLYRFLRKERANILALCRKKFLELSDERSSSHEMELGLPVFYDELIEVLRLDEDETKVPIEPVSGTVHHEAATRRGKESFRLGYTVSQVVHGYGALCQSITQYAAENSEEPIGAREFNRLNFCLDVAIAEAVTEFNRGQQDATTRNEVQRLGFLAHDVLVQRKLECRPVGVSELSGASCGSGRGILPRRFIALVPIPEWVLAA